MRTFPSLLPGPWLRGNPWAVLVLGIVGGLLLVGTFAPARAQVEVPGIQRLSPSSQVGTGVRLLREGKPEKAASLLRAILETDSTLTTSPYGAVAYWLGKAYAQAGQPEKAQTVWRSGLRSLRAHGGFDVRLADVYLRGLTPELLRGERLYAVDVYGALLRRVGPDTSQVRQALFRRRVSQVAPLMSDARLGRIIEEDRATEPAKWTFRPGAGSALLEWWRGLDPFPATAVNERLEEHLARLVHARRQYGCREHTRGLDERGVVYLRFGPPYKRRSINYENGQFFKEVYRFGVNIPPSSFPESEIWLYPHIDDSGYYLFAETDTSNCYAIAKANDLLPDYLTRRRANSERGLNIAYSALMAMKAIYQELALYHVNFSNRYVEIANYAGRQEMKATEAEVAERAGQEYQPAAGERSVTVGAGIGQTRRVFSNPASGLEFPNTFVSRMVERAERVDEAAAERRKEAMPRQHTTLLEGAAHLPVAVRTARFLTEEGSTQTEIYWGVSASALRLAEADTNASKPSLISFSAVQYGADHQVRRRTRRRYRIDATPGVGQQMIIPPPVMLDGTTGPYHIGLQWEQYELWPRDSAATDRGSLGQKRRMAMARADSLSPLRAEGPRIEMSDVKVMRLPDTTARTLAHPLEAAQPYPFRTLSADTPLLLSFEIYHLTHGADNRTRYTVSYETKGQTRRGWKELFLGEDTRRTSTEMKQQGTAHRTKETILLDLSKLRRDDPQDVRVTVRVTDEVTGTTVSRSVDFVLRPKGASN